MLKKQTQKIKEDNIVTQKTCHIRKMLCIFLEFEQFPVVYK